MDKLGVHDGRSFINMILYRIFDDMGYTRQLEYGKENILLYMPRRKVSMISLMTEIMCL